MLLFLGEKSVIRRIRRIRAASLALSHC
jgi:hypothetical protein